MNPHTVSLTMTKEGSDYVVTGKANIEYSGVGAGFFSSTKGFSSEDKYIHDNFYYQEFSYVIRVNQMLSKYRDIIKTLVHPAGVKLFGDYVISSTANVNITVIDEAPSVARGAVTVVYYGCGSRSSYSRI